MKWTITLLIFAPLCACTQGTFQNFDFEAASVSPSPPFGNPNPVAINLALPGWTAYLGADQQSQVAYNLDTIGAASIDLLGPTWNQVAPGIIGENYSVFLQSGLAPDHQTDVSASIEQLGTVPATAESVQFKAWIESVGTSTVTVSFDGHVLPLVALSSSETLNGQPYTVYGADISPYEGETGELEFTSLYNVHQPGLLLDDINFSTSAVPEPNPAILMGVGGLVFAAWRRFVRRKS